ncbi:hypothetical protein EW026_g2562 [Hermanssonia centrifuga]|uniref:protein-serine/threonine phosphatase n=1 Tax=Hermanssonia centrifuga TaxID=98765 RepID=A0A4S4KNY1_9APHY|nr:hypothetical protein EW026_g2562 [Hermanssonia centrifuga]
MAPQSEDEVNPNWEALKDVKKFRLGPEALGQPYLRGIKGKGKDKSVESEGCMYYIKPRPGWEGFLEAMATKYEMHVYTMGTRAYAEEVCAAIDPDGKIFGDYCEWLTLFLIIDDRADVWEWSPNLVKVIPYDFFVGIGDINSAFLPKLEPLTPTLPSGASRPGMTKPPAGPIPPETAVPDMDPISSPLHTEITPDESVSPSAEEEELAVLRKSEILARNAVALDAQVEQRPLAKMQEELQEEEDAQEADSQEEAGGNGDKPSDDTDIPRSTTPKSEKHVRKALLKNDDVELNRVQRLLEEVHQRYYDAYDHLHHDTMRGTVKVDAARRQGGIKIVWLAWFTDSIALWQRQDETPYLIDPEPVVVVGPASPPSDTHQISSDPEPDADDWDDDRAVPGKSLALDEVDWDEVNDEVDAAMNESDEDDDDMKSTFQGSNASEDDWTDESNSILSSASSTPRKKRKRLRSITPSDVSTNGHDDSLRSPLAKRKKMVANRSGTSKLKEAITADDLEDEEGSVGKRSAPASANGRDEDEEMEEDDDTGEDDDDFLARELGEDWG